MHTEIYEEMNPYIIFCKAVRRENCPQAGTSYKKRRVRWYELEFIVDGSGYIETNGICLQAESGALFFRKPGDIVQGFLPYYGYMIIFDMFYAREKEEAYLDPDFKGYNALEREAEAERAGESFAEIPSYITGLKIADYEERFEDIFHQYTLSGRQDQIYLKAMLYGILMKVLRDYEILRYMQNPSRSVKGNYKKVLKVKNYILDNVSTRFTLTDLARLSDLSPNFLCKIFKSVMGVNLFEYINAQKLDLVKKQLIDTDRSIKEIYFDCGFENESYFYRLFKKSVGKSPQQFREDYNQLNRNLMLDEMNE